MRSTVIYIQYGTLTSMDCKVVEDVDGDILIHRLKNNVPRPQSYGDRGGDNLFVYNSTQSFSSFAKQGVDRKRMCPGPSCQKDCQTKYDIPQPLVLTTKHRFSTL
jgi:NADPH-dependent glutamate synthase beta subunit-like oxidoreductase